MPAKSKKQERFMQAVANNSEFAKKVGVPTKVGKEFTKETKVKKYKEEGMSEKDKKPVPADKKDSLGKLPKDVRDKMGYMKKGGEVGMGMTKNNYKKGGKVYCKDGCAVRGKTKGRMV